MAVSPPSSSLLPMDWISDDFFLSRRISLSDSSSSSHSIEFSRARPADSELESYSDEQIIAIGTDLNSDPFYPVRWDRLQLDDSQGGDQIQSEDFEWEEVDGNNNDLGWEVLMAANSVGRTPLDPEDTDSYLVEDHEAFVYTSDFDADVVVSHLYDHDNFLKSRPPAAKSIIGNLPSIFLTEDELSKDEIQCAVCRDSIGSEQKVKRLPCMHNYHEECIVPWLSVRNTCPLCRHELPTDDPEYEDWKAQRVTNLSLSMDSDL
jgi:Ring finger domain